MKKTPEKAVPTMKNILCFGDSNTFGSDPTGKTPRHPRTVRWPGRLQSLLGEEYYVIEEGLGGRTTVWDDPLADNRCGLWFLPAALQSHQPLDLVILSLGTNDCKTIFSRSPRIITRGMGRLVDVVKRFAYRDGRVPKILLVAPIAIGADVEQSVFECFDNQSIETARQLGPLYEALARQTGCEYLNAALYAQPGCDQLHMTGEGHLALADAIAAKVRQMLETE